MWPQECERERAVAKNAKGKWEHPELCLISWRLLCAYLFNWECWIYKIFRYITIYVCMCACSVMSRLFPIPWTAARQASLSVEFSRQKSWSRLPFSPLWDLPDPGIEPASPSLAGRFLTPEPPGTPIFRTAVPHVHPESPWTIFQKLFLSFPDVTGKVIATQYFDMYEGGKKTLFFLNLKWIISN